MAATEPSLEKTRKKPSTRTFRQGQGGQFDTHKDRSAWFYQRAAFPLRDAPPEAQEKFWQDPARYPCVRGVKWTNAGPTNFAGRVTTLAMDPKDPKKLYAGSAAGGVWKSADGGASWEPCWPRLLNHNIGALAIHPVNAGWLYCATGEANLSADSYPGSGIYMTLDDGLTWISAFFAPGHESSATDNSALPRRVGAIAWGRAGEDDYRIGLGAVSNSETLPAALYLDQDGLRPIVFWGARSYNCHSIVFHPTAAGRLYAAIEPRGSQNGIWRSDDLGTTWRQLTKGLPPGEACRRISLAIAPSQPEVMYALTCSRGHGVLGVFRSGDGGEQWVEIGGQHFAHESQMSYNNTITVHPRDENFVVCGGVDLHLSKDGGQNWTQITTGQRGNAGDPFPANFVHSDHHAVVITPDGVIYSGNDGGVAMTEDGGQKWQERSNGMATTMFYAADVAQSNPKIFGGGTQDQGTLIAGVPDQAGAPDPADTVFTRVLAGDGGWIEFDPDDEEHVFGSTSNLLISRHSKGNPWAFGKQLGGWHNVSIPDELITAAEKEQRAIAVMEIGPHQEGAAKKVWVGTSRLWQTTDDGATWQAISPVFDDSAISAIECAPAQPQFLYAGTSTGGIFRSTDGGATWSDNLSSAMIPRRVITRIATHPTSAEKLVVTVASTGAPGTSLRVDAVPHTTPYPHVFLSEDSGQTWRSLDDNVLPDVVYNALAFETAPPYRIFAGGDAGVWVYNNPDPASQAPGGVWASLAGNMPSVVVSDLIYTKGILTAATYGRGFWRLGVEPASSWIIAPAEPKDPTDTPQAAGLLLDSSVAAPTLLSPRDGAVLTNFPRLLTLTWEPVADAIAYAVAVNLPDSPMALPGSNKPELTFDFGTDGKGVWQVWAILPDGRRSPGSKKRSFQYST